MSYIGLAPGKKKSLCFQTVGQGPIYSNIGGVMKFLPTQIVAYRLELLVFRDKN
jgi:hypothetical protein